MTKMKPEQWRDTLLKLRDRLEKNNATIRDEATSASGGESAGGLSNQPTHLADVGSLEAERDATIGIAENEAFILGEVEDALDRIREGRFGACENCGRPIAEERLQAIAYARHCIACARESQSAMR